MMLFILFILGACVGSFLGVLIDRLPKEEKIMMDRSRCDYCHIVLPAYALIPLVSYVLSRGKSFCCHKPLPVFYPCIELLTAALFVGSFLVSPNSVVAVSSCIIGSILLVIFFTDLFSGVIPVMLVLLGILVTGGMYLLLHVSFLPYLIGMGVAGGLFGFLILVTKGKGMGMGDLFFALLMGFLLGFPGIIVGLYIAFLTGAFISLILVIAKKRKLKGGSVPFVPFLILATIITILYGTQITAYFVSYFPRF